MHVMGGEKRAYSTDDIEAEGISETFSNDQCIQIYINEILAERIYKGMRFRDGRWGLQFQLAPVTAKFETVRVEGQVKKYSR